MKTRAKENVVDFVTHANHWVCNDGFRWIEGRSGSRGSKGLFLVPASDVGSIVQPPDDLHLRFFDIQPDKDSLLEFACQFGRLGVRLQHFHSEHTRIQHAESLADWLAAWESFHTVFTLWLQVESGSLAAVRRYLASTHLGNIATPLVMADPRLKRDSLRLARHSVVEAINRELAPATVAPIGEHRCFLPGCKWSGPRPSVRADVAVRLAWKHDAVGGERPEFSIQPDTLLGTVWLQFARYVCGERRVIRCEACGRLMDVTDSPRPGARRMHPECSNRICQQRFRERHRKPPGV
jgi:hypothetical protein